MQLFKISDGPWKKLFTGKFQENDIDIYTNPEDILLVLIFEKEKEKVIGVVVELFKIFHSEGEAEAFIETLPREAILLTKHEEKETTKFLLLGSGPNYIEWKENPFTEETDRLLKRLNTSSVMIKDISKAYELTLTELRESPEKIREAFFTQPLLVPLVSTSAHPGEGSMVAITKGEIILGLTKEKNQVIEPLRFFTQTLVSGGNEKERSHILHILAESALLSTTTVIVLDWENKFSGLGEASKQLEELKKYKVDSEPIGFPVKKFSLAKEVVVDLNHTNSAGLTEIFGVGENAASKTIALAMQGNKVKDMDELIEKLMAINPNEEITPYTLHKAARILELMNNRYPGMFNGNNDMAELSKKWGKIGRASIIGPEGVDERTALLLVHNLAKGMLEYAKTKEKQQGIKAILLVPDAKKVFYKGSENILTKELIEIIDELPGKGLGIMMETKLGTDLPKDLLGNIEARINIVSGNDAGVQLKDRKSYRVFVRPALSTCSEK